MEETINITQLREMCLNCASLQMCKDSLKEGLKITHYPENKNCIIQ